MIKIRSTEKLATSNKDGLCDIFREMLSYNENLKNGVVTIVVQDALFQEKTHSFLDDNTSENVEVLERKIIELKAPVAYSYDSQEIDALFSSLGVTISKTKSYKQQADENKEILLIAQTSQNLWQNMSQWTKDDGVYTLVKEFSI